MGQQSGNNTTGKEAGDAKDAPVDGKPGNATSGNGTSSDKSGNSDGKGEGEEDDEFHDTHDTHDTVVTANDPPRRRAPRKKPGVASALETADDDNTADLGENDISPNSINYDDSNLPPAPVSPSSSSPATHGTHCLKEDFSRVKALQIFFSRSSFVLSIPLIGVLRWVSL
ncbi:hypothetical protein CGCSCA5_v002928 [Colletotrichum siamense]|nr:hypothetical protein CGCSCA5_v002928 [Colletotrichum siamense]